MNILSFSLGGVAALTLATAAPAQAQQTETNTGLPYCSRNMQDNCIQRGDVKRNDFENRKDRGSPAMDSRAENPPLNPEAGTTPDTGMTPGPQTAPHTGMTPGQRSGPDTDLTPGLAPTPDARMPGTMPEAAPPTNPGPEMAPDDPAIPDAGVTE